MQTLQTVADTTQLTISNLFFRQIKRASLASAGRKDYSEELHRILQAYAPESSALLRLK